MIVPCTFCGHDVDTNALGTMRKTTGWVGRRAAGGGNAVRLPEHHDEWAHEACVDAAKRGIHTGRQGALL